MSPNIDKVVDSYVHAITAKYPKARYVGLLIDTFVVNYFITSFMLTYKGRLLFSCPFVEFTIGFSQEQLLIHDLTLCFKKSI